jgi:hypothetical protein
VYFLTPTVLKMDVSCSDQTRLKIKCWDVDLIIDSAQESIRTKGGGVRER